MAGTVTVHPIAVTGIANMNLVGSFDPAEALSDESDATYLEVADDDGACHVTFQAPDVPAGALIASARLVARAAWSGEQRQLIFAGPVSDTLTPDSTAGEVVGQLRTMQGAATTPGQVTVALWVPHRSGSSLELYELELRLSYDEQPTATVTNGGPVSTWTYDDDLRPQVGFEVVVRNTLDEVVASSGQQNGPAALWTIGILPEGDYTTSVRVRQQFQVPFWSEWDVDAWSQDEAAPNPPSSVTITVAAPTVTIGGSLVTGFPPPPAAGYLLEIERRIGTTGPWLPVITMPIQPVIPFQHVDRYAPLGVPVQWRLRTVRITPEGVQVASGWTTPIERTIPASRYWAKHATDPTLDTEIRVRGLPRTRPQPGTIHRPLDGSPAIAVDGPTQGLDGTLQLLALGQDAYDRLDRLYRARGAILLQAPDGRQWWKSWRGWDERPRRATRRSWEIDVPIVEIGPP